MLRKQNLRQTTSICNLTIILRQMMMKKKNLPIKNNNKKSNHRIFTKNQNLKSLKPYMIKTAKINNNSNQNNNLNKIMIISKTIRNNKKQKNHQKKQKNKKVHIKKLRVFLIIASFRKKKLKSLLKNTNGIMPIIKMPIFVCIRTLMFPKAVNC